MKTMLFIFIVALMIRMDSPCQGVLRIPTVKAVLHGMHPEIQECRVIGYFDVSTVPRIVTDRKWPTINTPTPDSLQLTLGGAWITRNKATLQRYQDKLVIVQGRLNFRKDPQSQDEARDFLLTQAPVIKQDANY